MRRRAKTDANQPEIVDALRSIGAAVYSLAECGDGIPDLLVGYKGETILLEVKDGSKPPSKRELTNDQVFFHTFWQGGPLFVVSTVSEALAALEVVG